MAYKKYFKKIHKKHGCNFYNGNCIYNVDWETYQSCNTEEEIKAWIDNREATRADRLTA